MPFFISKERIPSAMKKSEALKLVPKEHLPLVSSLNRLDLYYLNIKGWFGGTSKPIPIMITHFYTHGIKVKVLINDSMISHDGMFHIRYSRLDRYTLTPMLAEDLPLFAGQANSNMSEAFKRSIAFKKA